MEKHPILIKSPVSNKQPSLISSTRKIKKGKRTLRAQKYAVQTYFLMKQFDYFLVRLFVHAGSDD